MVKLSTGHSINDKYECHLEGRDRYHKYRITNLRRAEFHDHKDRDCYG